MATGSGWSTGAGRPRSGASFAERSGSPALDPDPLECERVLPLLLALEQAFDGLEGEVADERARLVDGDLVAGVGDEGEEEDRDEARTDAVGRGREPVVDGAEGDGAARRGGASSARASHTAAQPGRASGSGRPKCQRPSASWRWSPVSWRTEAYMPYSAGVPSMPSRGSSAVVDDGVEEELEAPDGARRRLAPVEELVPDLGGVGVDLVADLGEGRLERAGVSRPGTPRHCGSRCRGSGRRRRPRGGGRGGARPRRRGRPAARRPRGGRRRRPEGPRRVRGPSRGRRGRGRSRGGRRRRRGPRGGPSGRRSRRGGARPRRRCSPASGRT